MSTSTSTRPTARPSSGPWRPGRWAAIAVGVVSVALALGVAELIADLGALTGLLTTWASPFRSLGQGFIYLTPEWLKEIGIHLFGQSDKAALAVVMTVTLLVVGAVVGLVARRSPRIAVGITALLTAVALVAIYTREAFGDFDGVAMLAGTAAGMCLLVTAFRRTVVPAVRERRTGRGGAPDVAGSDLAGSDVAGSDVAGSKVAGSRAGASVVAGSSPAVTDTAPEPAGSATSGANHPMLRHRGTGVGGVGRRRFFQLAGLGAAAAGVALAVSRWIPSAADVAKSQAAVQLATDVDKQAVPAGADLKVPGQAPFLTPAADFYRVDTAFTPPQLTTDMWKLKIHGMVQKEVDLDFKALQARPQLERTITLTCVSNEVGGDLVGNATWTGARIDDLLKEAGPSSDADCVLITSVDGFTVTTPLDALTDGRDALLAISMNGDVLPVLHGFPVRVVVPGLYGYVSAVKWVTDMEVTQYSKVTAYWTQRGWSAKGPIKTSSRFDVPKGDAQFEQGDDVVLAGVAWAQHRGVQKVEVQVDGAGWQNCDLSESFSKDTWRQWKYTWKTPPSGQHTVRVRATDGAGAVQDATLRDVIPDGATGYDIRKIVIG